MNRTKDQQRLLRRRHGVSIMTITRTSCTLVVMFWLMQLSQPLVMKSMIVSSTNQRRTTTNSRRDLLQNVGSLITTTISLPPAAVFPLVVRPEAAVAAEEVQQQQQSGLLGVSEVAGLLKPIPTFVIVDKAGVPFFVVGEDAKVTGYFFTTYTEAARILNVAKTSADKSIAEAKRENNKNKKSKDEQQQKQDEEEIGSNPWKDARISTVPLDFAVTLTTKSNAMKRGGTYFQVAPTEVDIEDALELTGQNSLAEGKVPLFYDEDFTIIDDIDGKKKTPLYFRKKELEDAYKKNTNNKVNNGNNDGQSSKRELQTSVTELFAVITELVKPGGSDMDLKSLIFVTPKGSQQKKLECEKKGGKAPPFVFGQRNIIL